MVKGERRVGLVPSRVLTIFHGGPVPISRQGLPDPATFADVATFMRALVRERVGGLLGPSFRRGDR